MSNAHNFKTGDVVQLKSGGPKMTVDVVLTNGDVRCQWFAGSKLERGNFPPDSIIRPDDEKKD